MALQGPLSRRHAAATLWPDASTDAGQHSMRSVLWRLQGRAHEVLSHQGDVLHVAVDVDVDSHRLSRQARRILDLSPVDPDHPLVAPQGDVDDAVADVLGWGPLKDLLPDWDHDWLTVERERIRQLYVHALEAAACCLIARGSLGLALDTALRVAAVDPLREMPVRLAIEVLVREGDLAGANRAFGRYDRLLRDEIGLSPSTELRSRLSGRTRSPTSPGA